MEWTGARYADKPTVQVQIWVDAPPQRVWALVSDVELMPTMSKELQSIEWLDGATGPAVGARFTGHSKHEALGEWATTSEVIECEPERVLAWAVEDSRLRAAYDFARRGHLQLAQLPRRGSGRVSPARRASAPSLGCSRGPWARTGPVTR